MENLDFGYAQSKWGRRAARPRGQQHGLDAGSTAVPDLGVDERRRSKDDIAVRLLAFMIRHGVGVTAKNR